MHTDNETGDQGEEPQVKTIEIVAAGEDQKLTDDQVREAAALVAEGHVVQAEIGGTKVLIVGDLHSPGIRHLQLARLAALAGLSGEHLVMSNHDDQVRMARLEKLEPVIAEAEFENDRGKGKRRRPWESPYGYAGGKHNRRQESQRVKQMLRRGGGR